MQMKNLTHLFNSFSNIWSGGYFEGDCLDPLASSTYGQLGYVSVLHATYLRCIKPYVNPETTCLEIGPGRGAWTKSMLAAKSIHVIDILSAAHNGFFEYVGNHPNIVYHQVDNLSCNQLPDDTFDYMFSFGCLCHMPFECVTEYAHNLKPKLKSGANCFWLIADYEKFNNSIDKIGVNSIYRRLFGASSKFSFLNPILNLVSLRQMPCKISPDSNLDPSPMRWYNSGVGPVVEMLENLGYKVVDKDVGTCLRDPIIHFIKL